MGPRMSSKKPNPRSGAPNAPAAHPALVFIVDPEAVGDFDTAVPAPSASPTHPNPTRVDEQEGEPPPGPERAPQTTSR
jgi:hypothetical protein